jgi:DNA-binding transcriptional regulator YdaS (Cro superfamily)
MGQKEEAKRATAAHRRHHVVTGMGAGKSQAQMARELNISPERVNQIVKAERERQRPKP